MDRLSKRKRSWNMSRVPSRNTSPERAVRSALHRIGYRFRLQPIRLPGSPDVVLTRHKIAVFVHGCFWHHHGCKNSVWPRTRKKFWRDKIAATRNRDRRNQQELRSLGWCVRVIWECELERTRVLELIVQDLLCELKPATHGHYRQ